MEITKKIIEIEPDVYKSLLKYCDEEEISINQFIKLNIDCLRIY